MNKSVKQTTLVILLTMFVTFFGLTLSVQATEKPNYILGTTITQEVGSDSYYYKLEITSRSRVRVDMEVFDVVNASSYHTVDFYFERQVSYEDEPYDYQTRHELAAGKQESIEITLQPGNYYFKVLRSSRYACGYRFCISLLETIQEPLSPSTPTSVIGGLEMPYTLGTTFSAFNYQYDRSTIMYRFSVPYRTQLELDVFIKKNEYQEYHDFTEYADEFTLEEYDSYSSYHNFTNSNGISVKTFKVQHGTHGKATITLPKGEYYLVQDRSAFRADFTFCLKQGNVEPTSITIPNSISIEPDDLYFLRATVFPENATAAITYTSTNPKVATVAENGNVTGLTEGTTYIVATLPNGLSAKCKVKVKERTQLASVYAQIKDGYCYSDQIYISFRTNSKEDYPNSVPINPMHTYKIYRSNKKNGKYKYIGTTKSTLGLDSFTDKNVKPNRQYFYKVAVHIEGRSDFGPLSKAYSFWTAPKPTVTTTSVGNTIRWKKTKGATGYIVDEEYMRFLGYNIFFEKVYSCNNKYKMVKGTSYTRTCFNKFESGHTSPSDITVRAYAKHGKYYYIHGEKVTKNKKQYNCTVGTKRHWY